MTKDAIIAEMEGIIGAERPTLKDWPITQLAWMLLTCEAFNKKAENVEKLKALREVIDKNCDCIECEERRNVR